MKKQLQQLKNMLGFGQQTEIEASITQPPATKKQPLVEDPTWEQTFNERYTLADSPYREVILAMLKEIYFDAQTRSHSDDRMAIENALYCAAISRMSQREYNGDPKAYLAELLNDVNGGKYEFSQVCYDNDHASEVFFKLKMGLSQIYAEVTQ